VDANRLQSASLKTRATLASIIQKSPLHVPNEVNKLLYIPPVEGGDEPFMFLNYQPYDGLPVAEEDKEEKSSGKVI
jgi:hypothetical protein